MGCGFPALDNCCFNRPYDNQTYDIIRLETEAKIFVQNCIKDNKIELVWSFILDFENSANPYKERRESIREWISVSAENIKPTENIKNYANELQNLHGIKPKNSLHAACVIEAQCEYFLTTDKILMKKTIKLKEIKAVNPLEFIIYWKENENRFNNNV